MGRKNVGSMGASGIVKMTLCIRKIIRQKQFQTEHRNMELLYEPSKIKNT